MLPLYSATPTNVAPASTKNLEAQYPTLPNPWTINVFYATPGLTPNFSTIFWLFNICLAA